MKIKAYNRFKKSYRKLPENIQKKVDKQIALLLNDLKHPSLHTKKIKGREGILEARVDIYYRMSFEIVEDTIVLRVVGNHDEVLKNP